VNGTISYFSVIGQNPNGYAFAQNFRTLNRKTSQKTYKELSEITGLKMGQFNNIRKLSVFSKTING